MDEHKDHLKKVFQVLLDNQLMVKSSKCTFGQTQVEYLGHIILDTDMSDSSIIQVMKDSLTPKSTKALRGFLGLTGYYRKFFQYYVIIAKPLTFLTKKSLCIWNKEDEITFDKFKEAMMVSPIH